MKYRIVIVLILLSLSLITELCATEFQSPAMREFNFTQRRGGDRGACLKLANGFDITKSWELQLEFFINSFDDKHHSLFLWGDSRNGHDSLCIGLNNRQLIAGIWDETGSPEGGGSKVSFDLTPDILKKWVPIQFRYDSNQMLLGLSVNGKFVGTTRCLTPILDRQMPIYLGSTHGIHKFYGKLRNVSLINYKSELPMLTNEKRAQLRNIILRKMLQRALTTKVTLTVPYPKPKHDRVSVQNAINSIAKQSGLGYDYHKSHDNVGDLCLGYIYPELKNVPLFEALNRILSPKKLKYIIENKNIVLVKTIPRDVNTYSGRTVTVGQSPRTHGAVVRVLRMKSSKDTRTTWKTSWGSYNKDYKRMIRIKIKVRNMQPHADEFDVEWYFFGKTVVGYKRHMFDSGSTKMKLNPAQVGTLFKESKTLTAEDDRYRALRERYKSGSKIEGYVVVVKAEGIILDVAASNHTLKQMGRTGSLKITQ